MSERPPVQPHVPLLLTTDDVAQRLNISPRAVRRLTAEGHLPYVQVTRTCRRIPAEALDEFIAARTVPQMRRP